MLENAATAEKSADKIKENLELTLRIEAEAIIAASKRLAKSPAAVELVKEVEKSSGKVVLMGVGKSGVIAQKLAQTMASTGTPAIFVHPSDALHGSLGVIQSPDIVIAISNSGETDEILALLPGLKSRGVRIAAIVGNVKSTLAQNANYLIDASVDREACPLNLAPTASTAVALALGDAIAMAVMAQKNLTPEEFAANHPAGRLGRRLTLRVESLMHPNPGVAPQARFFDVVSEISKHALGAVTVVDNENRLVGIITDGDLRRVIERTETTKVMELEASRIMTKNPVTTTPETLAFEALKLMEDRPSQISVLPVTDHENKCLGLIRLHDIVRHGI